jgi:hypothetical protein
VAGDDLFINVEFDKPVVVSGVPELMLQLDGKTARAPFYGMCIIRWIKSRQTSAVVNFLNIVDLLSM